jgi:hypothetical protein
VRVLGRADHRALARGEELEERRVAAREVATARGEVAQRIAARRLDLHDVGARVAEELGRVRARNSGRKVDHAQIAQAVHGASS